jgi:hypothetical protein
MRSWLLRRTGAALLGVSLSYGVVAPPRRGHPPGLIYHTKINASTLSAAPVLRIPMAIHAFKCFFKNARIAG